MVVERVSNREKPARPRIKRPRQSLILTLIPWIFAAAAPILLLISVGMAVEAHRFEEDGVQTKGRVTSVETSVRTKDGRRTTTYKPTVVFTPLDSDTPVSFTARSSRRYTERQIVDVLYLPDEPQKARIGTKEGSGYRIAALIPAFIGSVFLLVSVPWIILRWRREARISRLLNEGTRIKAKIINVERNRSVKVNDRYPWRIVAEGPDHATKKVRTFKSENLWRDPTDDLPGDTVTVYIDRRNPKHYYMDVSFLPESK